MTNSQDLLCKMEDSPCGANRAGWGWLWWFPVFGGDVLFWSIMCTSSRQPSRESCWKCLLRNRAERWMRPRQVRVLQAGKGWLPVWWLWHWEKTIWSMSVASDSTSTIHFMDIKSVMTVTITWSVTTSIPAPAITIWSPVITWPFPHTSLSLYDPWPVPDPDSLCYILVAHSTKHVSSLMCIASCTVIWLLISLYFLHSDSYAPCIPLALCYPPYALCSHSLSHPN